MWISTQFIKYFSVQVCEVYLRRDEAELGAVRGRAPAQVQEEQGARPRAAAARAGARAAAPL